MLKVREHSGVSMPDEKKDIVQPSDGHALTDAKTHKPTKHPDADIIQAEISEIQKQNEESKKTAKAVLEATAKQQ